MDFARQQRDPTRHVLGITFVVLIHAFVIWALLTGLGQKVIEVVKKPLTATIIEEIKAPPPPPPPPPPPKKVIETPKPVIEQPFVPPPEVQVPSPPAEPVIANVAPTPPAQPVVIAPPAPPVVIAPPAPPKPAIRQGVSCAKRESPVFPREAIRAQVQKGRVNVVLTIDEKGNVADVRIVSSEPPRVFDRVVRDTLSEWKCSAEGSKYQASVEINFTLKDE